MRRWALVGLLGLLLAAGSILRFLETHRPPVAPVPCGEAIGIVDDSGERLGCLNDVAVRGCAGVKPGFRYRGCTPVGPISGAVLLMRGSRLSLSSATEEDLVALPGIGPTLAAKIAAGRQVKPLCKIEDLAHIAGVGAKRAQTIAEQIVFDDPRCPPLAQIR